KHKTCCPADKGFSNRGGNTHVHVAAVPQRVLLYTFVCVWRALTRTPNTHKRVQQLVVAAGDPPVRGYCPYSLKSRHMCFPPHPERERKSVARRAAARRATLFLSLFCRRRRPVLAEQDDF